MPPAVQFLYVQARVLAPPPSRKPGVEQMIPSANVKTKTLFKAQDKIASSVAVGSEVQLMY
jgi:hypothetical protein